MLSTARDLADHGRRLIPVAAVPAIVRRRTDKLWRNEAYRADCEAQMRFLLENTDRAHEIPELAYKYALQTVLRGHMRWHPKATTDIELQGVEWLTTKNDPSRPTILCFMHHARYDSIWGALVRQHGLWSDGIMTPEWMKPDAPARIKQHRKVCAMGAHLYPAEGGTDFMIERFLTPGNRFVIAPDIPGRTEVTFLNKTVLGSFGAARMAMLSNSQLVCVTSHRKDEFTPYARFHQPLEPADHADAAALNQAMLDLHGEAILAWPEAVDAPRARFGSVDTADAPA